MLSKFIFDKFYKSFYILMIVVNRSISKKCNLIKITKFSQNISTNTLGSNSLLILSPFIFESIDHIFKFFWIECSLCQGFYHGICNLCTIIWLALSGRFDDKERYKFESFEARKSCATFLTFTTTTYCLTIFCTSRIDYFRIEIFTFWTAHKRRD